MGRTGHKSTSPQIKAEANQEPPCNIVNHSNLILAGLKYSCFTLSGYYWKIELILKVLLTFVDIYI